MSEVPRAVAAAMSIASSLGLTVDDAIVLRDSNKLSLRLLPCDVLARVAPVEHQVAQFEIEIAQRLAPPGTSTRAPYWPEERRTCLCGSEPSPTMLDFKRLRFALL
jgi:uncharacterized protein (DUF2384 family)